MGERREAKKKETRERISDVATGLFFEKGFDAVTIDEIAAAAKVSKMTVFNYFARKEELLLDREDDLKLVPLRTAIRERKKGQSPVDAMRALLKELEAQRSPLTRIDSMTVNWWRIVNDSPALQARLRELADEAADGLAMELAGPKADGRTRLAAGLIVLSVRTGRAEAIRLIESGASAKRANAAFVEVLDAGLSAVEDLLPSP